MVGTDAARLVRLIEVSAPLVQQLGVLVTQDLFHGDLVAQQSQLVLGHLQISIIQYVVFAVFLFLQLQNVVG